MKKASSVGIVLSLFLFFFGVVGVLALTIQETDVITENNITHQIERNQLEQQALAQELEAKQAQLKGLEALAEATAQAQDASLLLGTPVQNEEKEEKIAYAKDPEPTATTPPAEDGVSEYDFDSFSEMVDAYLQDRDAGNAGTASSMVAIARKKFGDESAVIMTARLIGISNAESSLCKSNPSYTHKNCWGNFRNGEGTREFVHYDTWNEAYEGMFSLLHRRYNAPYKSLSEMHNEGVYCASGCSEWLKHSLSAAEEIISLSDKK